MYNLDCIMFYLLILECLSDVCRLTMQNMTLFINEYVYS